MGKNEGLKLALIRGCIIFKMKMVEHQTFAYFLTNTYAIQFQSTYKTFGPQKARNLIYKNVLASY